MADRQLRFRYALTPRGMEERVAVSIDAGGTIVRIEHAEGEAWDGWLALPGLPNAHSHSFQRLIAGYGERREGADSFWTWRQSMYRAAARLTPDDLFAVSRLAFVEMLQTGFTSVAEFHYLHHLVDGTPGLEMAEAVLEAAEAAGIRMRLLPVAYLAGDFGQPLAPEQRRFSHDSVEAYLRFLERLAPRQPGVAPHSLRAVPIEVMRELIEGAATIVGDAPVHIHISEQEREVEACRAHTGRTPIALLMDAVPVDQRWNLVHATHATDEEIAAVARSRASIVACPLTEAYLGDGLLDAVRFRDLGGSLSIGTDSNVHIDAFEELRLLEYGQRLRNRARAQLATDAGLSAPLYAQVAAAGSRAVGYPTGVIDVGALADIVEVPQDAPALLGHDIATTLDALVIAGTRQDIGRVWVGGRRVIDGGEHEQQIEAAHAFNEVARRLMRQA